MKWYSLIGVLLVVAGVMGWWWWPKSGYTWVMCDVGQGDGMVFSHGFSQLVVDTGPEEGGMLECLGKVMPFWDREIETVMITHPDTDHSGTLKTLLDYYRVDSVLVTPDEYEILSDIIKDRSFVYSVRQGDRLRWEGMDGTVLWPAAVGLSTRSTNNSSMVIRWQLGTTSLWLAGDAELAVEQKLLAFGRVTPSTILKVAHHGSRNATSEPFLAFLQPSQAWISVGQGNTYGHPHQEVVDRLKSRGIQIARTDTDGLVRLRLTEDGTIISR